MASRNSAGVAAAETAPTSEAPFVLRGVNHLALVCRDMDRTIDFYSNVLGMPLVKTITLPAGMGQHFFFDCGGGDCLAFFWFPAAPDGVPGISAPAGRPDQGDLTSAIGSMNHVAFSDDLHPGVFMRSVYFQDPDGILLEFASWIRP
jgi:catechol 2,3-dioxygenase-like lactoylglutathione lyase family enzyme